jgi:hypothetical protein
MDEGRWHSVSWMLVLGLGLTMICANSSPFGPTINQIGGAQKEDILANFIKTADDNNLSACNAIIDLKSPQLDIVDSSGIVPKPIDSGK